MENNSELSFGLPPFGRVPGFAIRNPISEIPNRSLLYAQSTDTLTGKPSACYAITQQFF